MTAPEPDYETLAISILSAADRMTDLVPAEMISSKLRRPWDATLTAVRVTRVGGLPTEERVAHLTRGRLQVECFAPTELTAYAGAAMAVAVLRDAPGIYDGVILTKVAQDLGLSNRPDPDSDSERYVAGVVLYGHPAPG